MIAEYYDINWNKLDTKDLITTHLHIPSTNFSNVWTGGEDGIPPIYNGSTVQQKEITASIELVAHGYLDYTLLRDYLYGIFGFGKPFYVVDKRQPGKRHRVILESNFIPTRHNSINGTADIPFITVGTHYAESIGTTQDIQRDGIDVDSGLWSYGMGLELIDESLIYTHSPVVNETFRIYNAGNVLIHPFKQDLKITITDVVGSDEIFQITNNTNGSRARVEKSLSSSDEVIYDGPNVTINSFAALRDTRKDFVELSPGWNAFQIYHCDSAKISFDFPFYYT